MSRMRVNPAREQASTPVMAAGTLAKPMEPGAPMEPGIPMEPQGPMEPEAQIAPQMADELAAREFEGMVAANRPHIFRLLLASTRDVDLAETLTQECFLKAHRSWGSFRGESSVMTWLMRIAINLEKDNWRNRRLQFWRQTRTHAVDVDEASEWLPSGERNAEQQLLAREQVQHVWRAVEKLSGRQRTIFLLRYVEEMELAEIAAATGLSEGTVKAHLSRGLSKVRAEVGGAR